jgi:hypothetical protein
MCDCVGSGGLGKTCIVKIVEPSTKVSFFGPLSIRIYGFGNWKPRVALGSHKERLEESTSGVLPSIIWVTGLEG